MYYLCTTVKNQLNLAYEKTPKTQCFQGPFEEFSYENVNLYKGFHRKTLNGYAFISYRRAVSFR